MFQLNHAAPMQLEGLTSLGFLPTAHRSWSGNFSRKVSVVSVAIYQDYHINYLISLDPVF